VEKACENCGAEFKVRQHRAETARFCCPQCATEFLFKGKPGPNLGRTFGPEVRAKISAARKGKPLSEEHKAAIRRTSRENGWVTKPELLTKMLRDVILDIGMVPDHRQLSSLGLPVYTTFYRAFGSWNDAVRAAGFEPNGGYGKRQKAKCGHEVRSTAECAVCNWLFEQGIAHEYEPSYGDDVRWHADWKVGETLIEYWGLCQFKSYRERRAEKERYAEAKGIRLLGIEPGEKPGDVLGVLHVAD
jgi:DNA-directed RNA polymerase subunit RPC12/RpoP